MKATTPKKITKVIRDFCEKIDFTQELVFVPVRPWENSGRQACFTNTPAYQKQYGGSIQCGWVIWETPGILLDATFHAIWVSPEGEFMDITPTDDGEENILFLPDSKRVYEHKLVESIREPLINDPVLMKLIEDDKFLFEIKKKHFKNDRIDNATVQAELERIGKGAYQLGQKIEKT